MKKYQPIANLDGLNVLLYGGHESLVNPLMQKIPGMTHMESRRHGLDTSSVQRYDHVFILTSKTSHSGYYDIRDSAKGKGCKVHTLTGKGSKLLAETMVELMNLEKIAA